jgi:hypothetical protein
MGTGSTARKPTGNQVAYLRRQITFATVADATISRYKLGVIPANSQIVYCMGTVKTAFSAAGTRVLTVGTNGTTANNILLTITEETATAVMPLIGAKLTFTVDTTIYIKNTTAGTAAAAGVAEIVVAYVPPEETT